MSEEQPKKKRVNSKKKGAGFENHVAKVLGNHLAPLQFRRSQSSGAILGGKNERLLKQFSIGAAALFVGDVVPTNDDELWLAERARFGCVIECKFYRDVETFDKLFGNTKLKGWLQQAIYNGKQLDRKPVVICKFNHTEEFCVVGSGVRPPKTVTQVLSYSEWVSESEMSGYKIFRLAEALQDRKWWLNEITAPVLEGGYVTIKDPG